MKRSSGLVVALSVSRPAFAAGPRRDAAHLDGHRHREKCPTEGGVKIEGGPYQYCTRTARSSSACA